MMSYWGYLHIDGGIVVKLFYPGMEDSILDAKSSKFVRKVFMPMKFNSREEALAHFKTLANQVQQ